MSATTTGQDTHVDSDKQHRSPRALCYFQTEALARTHEPALVADGFTILRARHGMHAYWLTLTAKPDIIVVEARCSDVANDYLLTRLRQNTKAAKIPVLVLTDSGELQEEINFEKPGLILVGDGVEPSVLAGHVDSALVEAEKQRQQQVDAVFSELDGDSSEVEPTSPSQPSRRTEFHGSHVVTRLLHEKERWSTSMTTK